MTQRVLSRQLVFRVLLGFTLAVVLGTAAHQLKIQDQLQASLLWIKSLGMVAPIAYIALFSLATVLIFPCSILTMGSGLVFGIGWGVFYSYLAAVIGSTLAFWVGRYLARDWVNRQLGQYPRLQSIYGAVAREGYRLVLLSRLSPAFPFVLLNYTFGITPISLRDYLTGSIGLLPGTIIYVYAGLVMGNIALLNSGKSEINPELYPLKVVILVIGIAIGLGITVYINRIAQKALSEA